MKLNRLCIVAYFALALPALAADASPKAQGYGAKPYINPADTNHDGFVSKEEWRARGDQMFAEIDTNHDGKLSAEETKAHHEKKRAEFKARRLARSSAASAAPAVK